MPFFPFLILAVLLCLAIASFIFIYRRHWTSRHATDKQIDVQILDKQSLSADEHQPGDDSEQYWLYVQPLSGGPKREFQVGVHFYHALTPGDCGTLTYRGRQFIHFALKR
ncbi:DUF2500 domain-containing protein [Photobacterium galatheae]|uniref:RNA polymerase subunit sigma n=1 Tax=Photobacterium galatheae TaxID=1654360 RepID=A0A066RYA0_9GAMM|nr:DUF2500 domain-containing protein [Photobacterium galatheae]KDM92363.1 RNA polymerase subunit sigma [Photobacterium galatheae]MCM0150872.1 DUF2500 domain-containing protein [Photobacterium galatheae]